MIHGDRDRIGQVLINLLANAVKYSPDADRIVVTVASSQDAVAVSVQDFGAGISAESQPHVFERFYRAPDEQQLAVHGLGLGLYVSAEIVRRHGGTIGVESMPGAGSIFHFSLPIQSSEDTLAELGSILSEELAHGA